MIDFAAIAETNQALFAELKKREEHLIDRELKAREVLETCEKERQSIGAERDALLRTEEIYRRRLGAGISTVQPTEASENLPRARIGDQRYRMFVALRTLGQASLERLAETTELMVRRVRDQMRQDVADGIVFLSDDLYTLTEKGLDLLTRFEDYKKNKGEPLPPVVGPFADSDGENEEPQPSHSEGTIMDG